MQCKCRLFQSASQCFRAPMVVKQSALGLSGVCDTLQPRPWLPTLSTRGGGAGVLHTDDQRRQPPSAPQRIIRASQRAGMTNSALRRIPCTNPRLYVPTHIKILYNLKALHTPVVTRSGTELRNGDVGIQGQTR